MRFDSTLISSLERPLNTLNPLAMVIVPSSILRVAMAMKTNSAKQNQVVVVGVAGGFAGGVPGDCCMTRTTMSTTSRISDKTLRTTIAVICLRLFCSRFFFARLPGVAAGVTGLGLRGGGERIAPATMADDGSRVATTEGVLGDNVGETAAPGAGGGAGGIAAGFGGPKCSGMISLADCHCGIPSRHNRESNVTRFSTIQSHNTCEDAGPNCPPAGGRTNQAAAPAVAKAMGIVFAPSEAGGGLALEVENPETDGAVLNEGVDGTDE